MARMMNIFGAVGMSRMIFCRINPDVFVDKYYRRNKLDIGIRCEILETFLRDLEKEITVEKLEGMPTIVEYKLFFDYNPLKEVYLDASCFILKTVLVKGEILDYTRNLDYTRTLERFDNLVEFCVDSK
jgi:hypothetical protein